MRKWKMAVWYECATKMRAMGTFYAIQYTIAMLITGILMICLKTSEVGYSGMEVSSIAFVAIVGVFGFYEDYKALIQNGFTRRYIFLATLGMFAAVCGLMALIDTVMGNLLHAFNSHYAALFGNLYGYGRFLTNWLWLTAVYLLACSVSYLVVLVIHRAGKVCTLLIGTALGGVALLVLTLLRFVASPEFTAKLAQFVMNAMGFMNDGTVCVWMPIATFLLAVGVLSIGSYLLIRRSELK